MVFLKINNMVFFNKYYCYLYYFCFDLEPYFEEYHTHQSTPVEDRSAENNATAIFVEPRNTVHKKDNLWTSLSIDD